MQHYRPLLQFCLAILLTTSLLSLSSVSAEPITVMSYNIRLDTAADGINAWPNRKDAVAEMMGAKYQTDIVGLQEALRHQLDEIAQRLPEYSWVGVGRDDGRDRGEFSPIFYRTDRFRLLATNTFWLSETPELPGSRSWDAAITRVVTWARFEDLLTGANVTVVNTHFDHRGELARIESARLLVSQLPKIVADTPFLITGDFNVPESAEAYRMMVDSPLLKDARYASESAHSGPTTSSNDWTTLRPEGSRIDYIFVSNSVRVSSHRILDDRYDGRFPSDHLPVMATVELNDDQR